jgi:hypothetical protein
VEVSRLAKSLLILIAAVCETGNSGCEITEHDVLWELKWSKVFLAASNILTRRFTFLQEVSLGPRIVEIASLDPQIVLLFLYRSIEGGTNCNPSIEKFFGVCMAAGVLCSLLSPISSLHYQRHNFVEMTSFSHVESHRRNPLHD